MNYRARDKVEFLSGLVENRSQLCENFNMGFLDRIGNKVSLPNSWIELTSISQIEELIEQSSEHPVVIFKHSVTCGISTGAFDRLLTFNQRLYYLDLLAHRDVSNFIAERFGVIHQSPQILLIHQGKCIFTTSHHAINPEIIQRKASELIQA